MATGASTAQLAIILVDARKGILPQTRRHSFIVSMLGVRHIVVAINKMDLVNFDPDVFAQIRSDYTQMVAKLGFESVTFIPISALHGDFVTARSDKAPWYDGATLLEHLEAIDVQPALSQSAGFSVPVQWVNRPNLDFRGYAGWVSHGRVCVGDGVQVLPSRQNSTIARIVTADGDLPLAEAEQAITLTLTDEIDISRGDLIVDLASNIQVSADLTARILWMGERSSRDVGRYILKMATVSANASLAHLHHAVDIHSYEPRTASVLKMNEIGLVQLALDKPVPFAPYTQNRDLGAFILIDRYTNETVALGTVEESIPLHTASDNQPISTRPQASVQATSLPHKAENTSREQKKRSLAKSITGLFVFIASLFIFWNILFYFMFSENSFIVPVLSSFVTLLLYYLHERLWARSSYGISPPADVPPNADGDGI